MSVLTRKFTLYPQGDEEEVNRVYKYIRNGQEVQAQMMNLCISALWKMQQEGVSKTDEVYKATEARYKRVPNEKKKEESAYYGLIDIEKYPTGISVAGNIVNMVKPKLDKPQEEQKRTVLSALFLLLLPPYHGTISLNFDRNSTKRSYFGLKPLILLG